MGHARSRASRIGIAFLNIFVLLLWSYPTEACGCGLLVSGADTERGWEYGNETTENVLIAYRDGIEHMFIGLEIQTRDAGAALITPVPGNPEQE